MTEINFNYSLELFKNSSTGHVVLNNKFSILKANRAFSSMVNASGDLVNSDFISLIFDDDIDIITDVFRQISNGEISSKSINIRYQSGDEPRWWKLHFDKVDAANTFMVMAVAVDINSEMESQGSLLEAKQAAERSEASKSIFLANMSHEIRTPIHTVTALAELLSDTNLDSEQREYVTQIDFAAKVLLTLINDILDFSKIEAGKLVFENIEYNLYETIINSVDLSALEAHKKGVDVAVSIDSNMPQYIIGDQVRLRQIIVNLMSNAVKFTNHGEIIIDVKTEEVDNDQIRLKISVCDSGIGISREKQARLFKAFSQADASTTRQFGGTGLGLSICSSLVQMMGGHISVHSKEGEGATFSFDVPMPLGKNIPYKCGEPPIKNLKALVVDDNVKVNRIFSDILRSWGYRVVEVYTVMDALNELIIKATMGEPYDLCFVDQILPGMDGWQLASEIHANSLIKTTKTLLMSLKGKGIEESKMKLLGWFQGYLTKPVCREDLFKTIEELYSRTQDVDMGNSLEDDELEELEPLNDEDLDSDDFMEPLTFADHAFDHIEELEAVEDLEPLDVDVPEDLAEEEEEFDVLNLEPEEEKIPLILVVEDHPVNQKLFKTILEKSGYNVLTAADGKEAVEITESNNLDLIFMDCQMPVMNGYDSSTKIRELGYALPIVAVTASAVKGEYEKCINSGMSDVMTKPFKKDDVYTSLDKWLPKE